MSLTAPLCVPVELARSQTRWFRLAREVGSDELLLGQPAPEELDGPLELAFHLPHDRDAIRCHARAEEVLVGAGEDERAERRRLRFLDLDEAARVRIERYVQERLLAE